MRKLILSMLLASFVATNAQIIVRDADEVKGQSSAAVMQSAKQEVDDSEARPNGGFIDIGWKNVENGFMIGYHMAFDNFFIGYDMSSVSSGSGSYKMEGEGWDITAGLRYRYYVADALWVEGEAGAAYYHAKVKFGTGKNKQESSEGKFGVMLFPRVGLNIWKGWGVYVGYRWDAPDFKFENSGAISAGICATF